MARTTHIPTSITVSDPKWGTVVWTPSPHGQKDLRKVPEEELPQAIAPRPSSTSRHLRSS
jgi:hypothetical protein